MGQNAAVHIERDKGREFRWKSDHAFVKISSEDSGGRYSLVEDNLTAEFHLPRHLHRNHSETFYVVSGIVEFELENRTVLLNAGGTLYIPPNQPHEVRCKEAAKMLTLYEPGGLEKLFVAYEAMSESEMLDPEKMRSVESAHDTIML